MSSPSFCCSSFSFTTPSQDTPIQTLTVLPSRDTFSPSPGSEAGRGTNRGSTGRCEFLSSAAAAAVLLGVASSGLVAGGVPPADALVKGNAPPAGYNKKRGSGYGNGEAGE